jgi:hypothetical protein
MKNLSQTVQSFINHHVYLLVTTPLLVLESPFSPFLMKPRSTERGWDGERRGVWAPQLCRSWCPIAKLKSLTWLTTSSTAQGGGGSFKNRKPIGEVGCCDSGMAERSHWWTERCLISLSLFFLCLSFSLCFSIFLWLSTYLPTDLSVYLSIYLSVYLSPYLSI